MAEKEKSALYPAVTWNDCIALIEKLDVYKGKVSYDSFASEAYGLKNASTKSFTAKISAAKQFGLILTNAGTLQLTDLAKQFLYPTNAYIKDEIIAKCFIMPPLYEKLVERFNEKTMPKIDILANILMSDFKIVRAVKDNAAKCFLENAQQMGFYANGVLQYKIVAGSDINQASTQLIVNNQCVDDEQEVVDNQQKKEVQTAKVPVYEKEYVQLNYETESGKIAQIIIPKDATKDDLTAIKDMLTILIKRRFKIDIE